VDLPPQRMVVVRRDEPRVKRANHEKCECYLISDGIRAARSPPWRAIALSSVDRKSDRSRLRGYSSWVRARFWERLSRAFRKYAYAAGFSAFRPSLENHKMLFSSRLFGWLKLKVGLSEHFERNSTMFVPVNL